MSPRPARPASAAVAVVPVDPSNLPTLAPDVVQALLQSQRESITEVQRLPAIKVMPQGIGMFEFTDDNATEREFFGIILHSHARNVLWDKPFGYEADPNDEFANLPACASPDGIEAAPRPLFTHLSLRTQSGAGPVVVATGNELLECRTCAYNAWGSAALIAKTGKGKACSNQRAVYILIEGREAPMELTLPPTSISSLDEYLTTMTNRQKPVQTVITKFSQRVDTRGSLRWGVAKFEMASELTREQVAGVLAKRSAYMTAMSPQLAPARITVAESADLTSTADDDTLSF